MLYGLRLITALIVAFGCLVAQVVAQPQPVPKIILLQGFDGPVETQGLEPPPFEYTPPDPTIAVGTANIIITVNSYMYIYDKALLSAPPVVVPCEGLNGLFQVDLTKIFDPRCAYDHYADRFVVAAVHLEGGYVFLAASQAGDPTVFPWNVVGPRHDPFTDFTGLGYDRYYYYVTVNTDPVVQGAAIFAVNKDPLYSYLPIEVPGRALMPAVAWDDPGYGYFVEAKRIDSSHTGINVYAWDHDSRELTSNSPAYVEIAPSWTDPDVAIKECTHLFSDVQRKALRNCVFRSGMLYSGHAIKEGPQRPRVQCYEILLNGWPDANQPTVDAPDLMEATPPTFMPAIARNSRGYVAMVVATSDNGVPPGVGVIGRLPSPPHSWGPVVNLKTGLCVPQNGRWGDYLGIAVDPVDDTFWVVGEYWKADGVGNQYWAIWVQNFDIQ
ncbi:MAG: hypothetical protein AB1486_11840 [Planctomycetota bacterium]